jgi:hypothetical protein
MQRAQRAAWTSIALALAVLALLLAIGGRQLGEARRELGSVQEDLDSKQRELQRVTSELAGMRTEQERLGGELDRMRKERQALVAFFDAVPEAQRRQAVQRQEQADPATAALLPRVYLQIVDEADRAWADEVRRRFVAAGLVVPGIELVRAAAGLRATQVRYYRQSELPGARRVHDALGQMGVQAELVDLKLGDSARVRPNHFEVWFVAGSRRVELAAR